MKHDRRPFAREVYGSKTPPEGKTDRRQLDMSASGNKDTPKRSMARLEFATHPVTQRVAHVVQQCVAKLSCG